MHRLKEYLMVWFICGVIFLIIGPSCGELMQSANETEAQSIRPRERQHQSQYQYGSSKPANKQQPNRGRNGLNELRKNLTQQKLYERQGDDPDQNSGIRSPIHMIQQKIQQSDVSTPIHCIYFSISLFWHFYLKFSHSENLIDIEKKGLNGFKIQINIDWCI